MGELNDRKRQRQAKEQRGRCFYCHLPLRDDMTWEHLVPRAHKGSNKISNMRVAHSKCNSMVGTLPLKVKLALHDIGRELGSDAFFLLASRLKPQANCHLEHVVHQRRPKRQPAAQHAATILQLVRQLPAEMTVDMTTRAAA